ncbi:MAG: hypothetical protein M1826_001588 [Phylliscum demangeonii]|nr:MAG: hypothetical protein M1826_001588 [Phylliscum demangeonii]
MIGEKTVKTSVLGVAGYVAAMIVARRLPCKIESNFKRVGKRSRNAEMERELAELRKRLASTAEPITLDATAVPPFGDHSVRSSAPIRLSVKLEPHLHHTGSDEVVALYSNPMDPVGLAPDGERSSLCSLLASEFEILSSQRETTLSAINHLHLAAANLHLRLSAFFDSSKTKSDRQDLFNLYFATTSFLKQMLSLETSDAGLLLYAPNYILQMILAGGFALYKLLNSFFGAHVDLEEGRTSFNQTISAIRSVSVVANDLPARLAEVLAQRWRGARAGPNGFTTPDNKAPQRGMPSGRQSDAETAVRNATNPDIAAERSSSSTASTSPSSASTAAGSRAPSSGSIDGLLTTSFHHHPASPDAHQDLRTPIASGPNEGLFDLESA